jgi:hypothetical protein
MGDLENPGFGADEMKSVVLINGRLDGTLTRQRTQLTTQGGV